MPLTKAELRQKLSAIEPTESIYEGIGPSDVELLRELLDDQEAWLAARAAYALSRIDSQSAHNALVAASESPRPEVRVAVAASASVLPSSVSDQVLSALLEDSDVGVRKFAIQSVSERNSSAVKERLAAVAASETVPQLRQTADVQARSLPGDVAPPSFEPSEAPPVNDIETTTYGEGGEGAPPGMGAEPPSYGADSGAPSHGGGVEGAPAGMGWEPPTYGVGGAGAPPGMGAEGPSGGGGESGVSAYGTGSEAAPGGTGTEGAPPGMGWQAPTQGAGAEGAPPGMGAEAPASVSGGGRTDAQEAPPGMGWEPPSYGTGSGATPPGMGQRRD